MSRITLSDYIEAHGSRDNNFNLIRIVAALAVLVTHSFVLVTGDPRSEPLYESLGMTIGSFAVDVFFVLSGFLVTASLLKHHSLLDFAWARVLRIFPGLWVMLWLTVLGVGPWFTSGSLQAYFHARQTWAYLASCGTLVLGVGYALPGVFDANPLAAVVNGSLWTMPYEVQMYIILAFAWLVLSRVPAAGSRWLERSILVLACASGLYAVLAHFGKLRGEDYAHFVFMFFTGASIHVCRQRVVLSGTACAACIAALLLSGVHRDAFFVVYMLSVAYLLFYLAHVPGGALRRFNRLGDYSYGVYIYGFVIQQSLAAAMPGLSVLSMILASSALSLLIAVASWHLIERRALDLKHACIATTRRRLATWAARRRREAPAAGGADVDAVARSAGREAG